ncbi:THO complex subunit 5 homolog A-like [Physella acuta]|uniref:THO complex subunit 5 homolog A-like n=1 Tax=Physella acuta TaxID=109671 RepID=UPI0027DBF583|nr:THO complex subunit 5 homolog A-like [Physella acuta]
MSKDDCIVVEGKKKRLLKPDLCPGIVDLKKHKHSQDLKVDLKPFISEEDEAMERDPLVDLASFQASCTFLKTAIRDIKEIKTKKLDMSSSEIDSIRTDATIHFIHMKKLNRLAHFRCRKVRENTNEAKHKIDQCHLQLQNLLYEAMHLEKEITKCMEFKSKDEEVELVKVEEFYKDAPISISNPNVTKEDAHLQMLARLEWELEQRKQLAIKLTDTKSNKEQISQEIQAKHDYLETLQPKLSAILHATRPVQDYLSMPYDAIKEEHQKAQHLPVPLYILYMQTSAYKDACDKFIKVVIQGDVDAAQSQLMWTFEPDEDSDSDMEDQEKQDVKRRRNTSEMRNEEKKNRVLKKHPLSVAVDINSDDGTELQLTFYYLLALNIITVNVKVTPGAKVMTSSSTGSDLMSPDMILDELYPGDHGNESPNLANHYELKRHGLQELDSYISLIGRPYLWCQWMGGLQFLKKDLNNSEELATEDESAGIVKLSQVRAQHSVSSANMQKTITLLKERVNARVCLLQQLSSLERNIIPVSSASVKMFPTKINAQLTSWRRSSFVDLKSLPQAERFIKAGLVHSTDFIFMATIDRGSAKMTAFVVLTSDSPKVAPLIIVDIMWQSRRTALTDIYVMEMEEEVNVHYQELLNGNVKDQLLPNQLQRLLMCFDVYLETDIPASSLVPIEIPKEKMMPRTSRGPARSKPFKYVPELGIFTHRCFT